MRLASLFTIVIALVFLNCSKSYEEKGDAFLKKGQKRNAYIFYQKAIGNAKGNPSSQLKGKYLDLTLERAKQRLIDDESLESVNLFRDVFTKYLGDDTSVRTKRAYALFLSEWSDSVFIKFENIGGASDLLEEAIKIEPGNQTIVQKRADLHQRYGKLSLSRGIEKLKEARSGKHPLLMIEAEYHALCAEKYLPEDKLVQKLLKKTRKKNWRTYSAYDRAFDDGRTDPDIDKYSIYIAFTKQAFSKSQLSVSGSIYNLSRVPFDLHSKQFTLVDKKGNKYQPKLSSKFEKITLDVKAESKFTLKFRRTKASPKVLLFKEKEQTAAKYW